MRSMISFAIAICFLHSSSLAQQQKQILKLPGAASAVPPEASYGLGYDVGAQLASGGIEASDISANDFVRGLVDALAKKDPTVDQNAVRQAMEQLGKVVEERKIAANAKFLEDNKKKDGVQVTESGLQYEVLKSGNGAMPTAQNRVSVHYEGRLINGRVFDSSIQRGQPATFQVTGVIKGWTEALLRMKVGDKWRLVIPSSLAYGEDGSPPVIGPNETLVFDVELLQVQ